MCMCVLAGVCVILHQTRYESKSIYPSGHNSHMFILPGLSSVVKCKNVNTLHLILQLRRSSCSSADKGTYAVVVSIQVILWT